MKAIGSTRTLFRALARSGVTMWTVALLPTLSCSSSAYTYCEASGTGSVTSCFCSDGTPPTAAEAVSDGPITTTCAGLAEWAECCIGRSGFCECSTTPFTSLNDCSSDGRYTSTNIPVTACGMSGDVNGGTGGAGGSGSADSGNPHTDSGSCIPQLDPCTSPNDNCCNSGSLGDYAPSFCVQHSSTDVLHCCAPAIPGSCSSSSGGADSGACKGSGEDCSDSSECCSGNCNTEDGSPTFDTCQ
jgi:hypothetical protein